MRFSPARRVCVLFSAVLAIATAALGQSAPSITTQPASQTVIATSNAVFSVVASGQTPLTYQWSKNGINLNNGGNIIGVTNAVFTVAATTANDVGSYRVVVTNRHGSVTSSVATLTVILPPAISSIANQRMFPNGPARTLSFTISDPQNNASNLTVTAASSNTSVIPNANITVGGSGANRTITVTPAGAFGTSTVTVTLQNTFGAKTSTSFSVNVAAFTEIASGITPLASGRMQWVDLDNDGQLDLYLDGVDQSFVWQNGFYRNTGNGAFTRNTNNTPNALDWADFDNDGFVDFVAIGAVYHNNHDGTFTQVASIPDSSTSAAIWGDFDNDGKPDIAITGWSYATVLRNNGNGTFTDLHVPLQAAGFGTITCADFDNDGLLDIVLAGNVNNSFQTHVYLNKGNGTFQDLGMPLPGLNGRNTIAWGDYNGDGKIDLLISGSFGANSDAISQILRNDSTQHQRPDTRREQQRGRVGGFRQRRSPGLFRGRIENRWLQLFLRHFPQRRHRHIRQQRHRLDRHLRRRGELG